MNIIEAIEDENLFKPFLGDNLDSWKNWIVFLRAVYGFPIRSKASREIAQLCTGRDPLDFPESGYSVGVCLTGRRSGKSRLAAIIGAYEAVLAGHEKKLSKGERGVVIICAPSKSQGRIVKDYLQKGIFEVPMLREQVVAETKQGFELESGVRIEIQAGDWRTIRGFTVLAAIVDEACFFGYDAESNVKSDTELIRALQPALATTNGRILAISSPYSKKGWCYSQYKKSREPNYKGNVLVWNCGSRVMNPTLSQSIIDEAMAEDLQAAKSEYLGEFRDDIAAFIPRAVVEQLVVPGRKELPPDKHRSYSAFVDVSGGRGDDSTLAIAHREGSKIVLDLLHRWRPPFNPHSVIAKMADTIARYHTYQVTGDNYAAEFVSRAFSSCGIGYRKSEKSASVLYAELLPKLCSQEIELLDDPVLVDQLASLERRCRPAGRDQISHPPGAHDDLANSAAGVAECLSVGVRRIGGMISKPQVFSLTEN